MEAMWTRFLPAWAAIIDLVAAGRIGRVQSARIRLGNAADPSVRARSRLFDAARAGGALLDTGIYPLSIAHMVLGPGQVVRARATLLDGVDVHTWITADHDGVPVELETAIDEDLDSTAAFLGTDGEIHVPAPCHHPTGFRLVTSDGDRWVDAPYDGGGFEGQIAAFEAAVGQGRSEVPAWPHAATLATHGLLDDVRRRIGLQFPFEQGLP